MDFVGVRYDGDLVKDRVEGKDGKFYFQNGAVYQGDFKDGQFHGKGTIYYPNGGTYEAMWENGKAVDGTYTFPDKLVYSDSNWDYCQYPDRRFHSERMNGIPPAGQTQLTDHVPPPEIPVGTYDCGDGYYDPKQERVFSYPPKNEFIRAVTDHEEQQRIMRTYRIGRKPVEKTDA